MPYIVKQEIIGGRTKVEYLPPDPHEIEIGYRREKREGENLRVGIMRDQELADSASIAAEQRAEPEERIVTREELAEHEKEQKRILGALWAGYQGI